MSETDTSERQSIRDEEFRSALKDRLQDYGGGWTDPTDHENDCMYAVSAICWLEKRLKERDDFIVGSGMWETFVSALPTPSPQ